MTAVDLKGIIPPLVTPLHPDGALNLEAVPVLVEHVLRGGVHGVFVAGSQGEAYALTLDERARLLDAVLVAVNGRVPVIAGTGAITTRDAITFTQAADRAGVDAVSVITPYFISPSQQELYAYYMDVAAATTLPMLAYSNPIRTGNVRLVPSTLARLATDIPHLVGVKESSADLVETAAILRICPDGFRVFVGRDSLVYAGLCYGAVGGVGLAMNILPDVAVALYDAFQAGDHARARAIQQRLSILRDGLPRFGTYPLYVKEALALMGLPAGPARRPVLPLSDEERAGLRDLLRSVGVDV